MLSNFCSVNNYIFFYEIKRHVYKWCVQLLNIIYIMSTLEDKQLHKSIKSVYQKKRFCFQGNRCLGTENNVACVATNQKQSIEWQVTETCDTTAEYVTAQLVTNVRILCEKQKNKK